MLRAAILSFAVVVIFQRLHVTASEHSDFGGLDRYKISWKGPITIDTPDNDEDENAITITTKYNEQYKCIVPDNVGNLNFDTSAKNSSSSDAIKSPIQVLEPFLRSNYCSHKFDPFWVYELCHGKFLRQYHEESTKYKTKITQEFFLGRLEPDHIKAHIEEYDRKKQELERTGQSRPTILVNGHYKPYVMFNMTGGTTCDLTKSDRISRVIYVCNDDPKHELYSIKETSTCEYEAIVLSPLLCQHKDFRVDTNLQHEIKCYSMDGAPKRPANVLEPWELDEMKEASKRRVAYLQGRTLIIDADLILS